MLPRPVTALLLGIWALAPVTLGFKRTNIKFNKNTGGYQDIVVVVSEDLSAASCPQILDNIKVCAASNHSDSICFLSLVKCFIWRAVCQELMTKKDANYFEELKYLSWIKEYLFWPPWAWVLSRIASFFGSRMFVWMTAWVLETI